MYLYCKKYIKNSIKFVKIVRFNNNLVMFLRPILRYAYQVITRTCGTTAPFPSMTQHYLTDDQGRILSFWNDLPIGLTSTSVNVCIEIPKEQVSKFQVAKSYEHHPMMQETKLNPFSQQLQYRYFAQYPLFNYGFIPQTWEQNITQDQNGLKGDDDPLDICDISQKTKKLAQFYRAKILGGFCLIDQGEIDWKILVIDEKEAKDNKIESMKDFPQKKTRAILEWFKHIKLFDGKKMNQIAFDQKVFGPDQTMSVIRNTHLDWRKLMTEQQKDYKSLREKYHLQTVKLPQLPWRDQQQRKK